MRLTDLERQILAAARQGHVVVAPGTINAVGSAYQHLEQYGLLNADWWGEDIVPVMVAITPAGETVLRYQD